jgi:outer membrane protein TolC
MRVSFLRDFLKFFSDLRYVSKVRFFGSVATIFAAVLHVCGLQKLEAQTYSVVDLLKMVEASPLIVDESLANQRLAQARAQQVEMNRWLSTLEAKVFSGFVPDAKLTDERDVNSYRAFDLESNFSFDRLGPFVRAQIEVVQPLWTFGKITAYQDAAQRGFTLADAELRKRQNEMRLLIKRAYYTLLLSNESLQTLEEVGDRLSDAADKVEDLLLQDAENVSEVDRLKIKVFEADVRNRRIDAERGRRISKTVLSDLLGLTGDWNLAEQKLEPEQVVGLARADVVSAALRARPDLQQLQALIEIKEAEVRVERASLFPTVFLGGQMNYAYTPGRTDVNNPYLVDDFNKWDLGAVLGMRLDLGFHRTLNKVEVKRAELDRLKAQQAQLTLKVKLDAERLYEEASGAASGIGINEDGLRAARSWLTSSGLAFNLGTAETKEILESFAAYFKARADLVRSIYSLNMALSELSEAAGKEFVDRLALKP